MGLPETAGAPYRMPAMMVRLRSRLALLLVLAAFAVEALLPFAVAHADQPSVSTPAVSIPCHAAPAQSPATGDPDRGALKPVGCAHLMGALCCSLIPAPPVAGAQAERRGPPLRTAEIPAPAGIRPAVELPPPRPVS